ncbi:MAG: D-alanine--D-alanine ligase [Lachnospiraceae bacterium]|nr:D-alanine--D-alanine ligase [Lachnospiraceae bacterium]
MKIIVLAGGLSTERDVSLASGVGICRSLLELGHETFLLDAYLGLPHPPENLNDIFQLPGRGMNHITSIPGSEPDLETIRKQRTTNADCYFGPNVIALCQLADIVFIGLHGGEGENGTVQAAFDLMGIRYTGTGHLGCAVSMDKGLTKEIFLTTEVNTPKGFIQHKDAPMIDVTEWGLDFPIVLKPCSGGSSIGVFIVHTIDAYHKALKKSFRYEDEIVVEEYIIGREFSCGILDNQILPPIEIIPNVGFFDYANKYQAGATQEICPALIDEEITKEMQALTLKAFQVLKLQVYARADFILDQNNKLYCLEINTLPGMTTTSLLPQEANAMGITYGELCETIIKKSMKIR